MKNKVFILLFVFVIFTTIVSASSIEQIFKINLETEKNNINQSVITIDKIIEPTSSYNNPLEFKFNISYNSTDNINCDLKINNELINNGFDFSVEKSLLNGSYSWSYTCYDINTPSIESISTGNFNIEEHFWVEDLKKVYLLKKWNKELVNKNTIYLKSKKQSNVEFYIERPGSLSNTNNKSGTSPYGLQINEEIVKEKGIYKIKSYFDRLEKDFQLEKELLVSEIEISHPTEGIKGEEISIFIDIDSSQISKDIENIRIEFDNSGSVYLDDLNLKTDHYIKTIKNTYNKVGNFDIKVIFEIDGIPFEIKKDQIKITSNEDNTEPEINLIYPTEEMELNSDNINFKFEVSDNKKIDKCNFSIYNATYNSGVWTYSESSRVYLQKIENPDEDSTIEIELVDFLERGYSWEVECLDNSSNYNFETNYFDINLNSSTGSNSLSNEEEEKDYERKEDVERLIEIANEFISKEESWNKDEKEALTNLNLIEDVKYYKKRLLDIEQTLSKNLGFISDADLREKRKKESLEEIDLIQENLPTSFELVEKYEYVKNGNTFDWEEIIKEYLEESKTKVSSSISNIKENNINLQDQIVVSTVVQKIKIDYEFDSEEFILVNKKVDIKNSSIEKILEIIPESIVSSSSKIEFITKTKNYSEGKIIEIKTEDLEDNYIRYKIHENIDLKKLEETDTVLFTEKGSSDGFKNTISGFLVLGSNSEFEINTTLFFIILIFVFLILSIWIYSMYRRLKLKKDPNTYRILELLGKIKDNLKEDNITDARENYKKIQEAYSVLDQKFKKQIIDKIKIALIAIDKKDIYSLVEEYRKEKKSGNEEEAKEIYQKVQKIYTRLPEKNRKKVLEGLKQSPEVKIEKKKLDMNKEARIEISNKIPIKENNEIVKEIKDELILDTEKKSTFY